ncbi:MAG: BNR-4 repeat-containing protein [Thermoleophilia bacterium]|jgi:tRNA(Arg) A34 adenosine deaminase TadA|nr:BNR-4 repeat-containing protein [Thermoleophilia bacterium]
MTLTLTSLGSRRAGPPAQGRGPGRGLRGALLAALAALGLLALAPGAAADTLPLPLPISTSESFLDQFGYAPDYQRHIPAFDTGNRPVIRSRTASQNDTLYADFLENGAWRRSVLDDVLRAAYPAFAGYMGAGGYASDRVVFDTSGRAYTIVTIRLEEGEFRNVLLYSADRGLSWGTVALPFGAAQPYRDDANRGNIACEMPSGQRGISGPPFIAAWREIGDWPGTFASLNELYVMQPRWEGDKVVVPEPVLVTSRFLGMLQSVGDTSFATTVGGKTYFTWTQVRDTPTLGTPTYVGVYDRATNKVTRRVRAAFGHPVNDSHCTPAMVIDSRGYIHLVAGAHHRPFRYTRSVRPLDISEWKPEVKVLDSGFWTEDTDSDGEGRQTYASLVCGADDTLHLVFRQMRRSRTGLFPLVPYFALSYQKRPLGEPWSKARMLAYSAGGGGYVNYYHKLTTDQNGRLYLSFNVYRHRDTAKLYRVLRRFRYRMVWSSPDGRSWEFAMTESMARSAAPVEAPAVEGVPDISSSPTPIPPPVETVTLTDTEKASAVEAAMADDRLQEALGETGRWIEDVAPWTRGVDDEVLGAAVLVYLDDPISVDADWPFSQTDATVADDGTVTSHVTADGLTAVKVLVDLGAETVAEIAPYVYESATRDGVPLADTVPDEYADPAVEAAMSLAIETALEGATFGEQPSGAVVLDAGGAVIARAHDEIVSRRDPTAHAGLLAVQRAVAQRGPDLRGCTLVCTVEPCGMCFQAAWWAGVSRLTYGLSLRDLQEVAPAALEELVIDTATLNDRAVRRLEVTGGVLRTQCLESWR